MPYWHSCFHYGRHGDEGEEDENDEDDDEGEIDNKKSCGLDETATMTTDIRVIDVAVSQITVYVEEAGKGCCSGPGTGKSCQPAEKEEPKCREDCRAKCAEKKWFHLPFWSNNLGKCKRSNRIPNYLIYIIVIGMYALVHAVLGLVANRGALYDVFLSSQICGFIAYVIWRLTGTIPL